MLIQILLLLTFFGLFYEYLKYFYLITIILAIIMITYILNKEDTPEYKIAWIIPIAIFPPFGVLLYILFNIQYKSKSIGKKISKNNDLIKKINIQDEKLLENIKKDNLQVYNLVNYLNNCSPYTICDNTNTTFFKSGEDKFKQLIKDLKEAKNFIFLEYFIISQGELWTEILDILKEKAKEKVDIRILYDGMCEMQVLPQNYADILKKYNIKVKVVNPVVPTLSTYQNNRDHRKIVVIDGKIAYTGGINIGDEYINKKIRFGYWKDTAIRLEGLAVNNFTMMFLSMWNIYDNKKNNYKDYLIDYKVKSNGYVLPYADSPLDKNLIAKTVYMDIINTSTNYVHIETPYLILDNEIKSALKYAAKRGVDVKIIMPHIPDKKYAFYLSQTYYKELLNAGIKIYEYTNGFVHSKVFVSDLNKAVVGTVNLDYRSLYLHFECATYLYKTDSIKDIDKDFNELVSNSEEITIEKNKKRPIIKKIYGQILRLFAPLM